MFQVVNFIYDTECSEDLTNFRIDLLVRTTKTIATAVGYDVKINETSPNGLYFTYKSNLPKDSEGNHKIVLCGPVLNANAIGKEKKLSIVDYKR